MADIRKIVAGIKCPPYHIRLIDHGTSWSVTAYVIAPDSTIGIDGPISWVTQASRWDKSHVEEMPDRWVIEAVRHILTGLACHEVDEFFTLNGQRIFDPHHRP